jgi:hypothetical protein
MNEKRKAIMDKIGLIDYTKIKKGLDMAEATPNKKVFHVTKNKKILAEKELIQKNYPNLCVFTEEEWLKYAFNKLSPEEQKKVKKKIIDKIKEK